MLTPNDLMLLQKRGISEEKLNAQLDRFRTGFPYLKIYAPATPGKGITVLDDVQQHEAVERWEQYLADGGTVCKFVPASGAASRMFKSLFAFVDSEASQPAEGSDVAKLLAGIHQAAFFKELDAATHKRFGVGVDGLLAEGRAKDVVSTIISPDGLNYGNLPKGLLTFHHAGTNATRTPLEEQLAEGAQSARQADGTVNLHLTVSGAHRKAFEAKIDKAVPKLEAQLGVKINVSLSEQKPSTDTVAANPDGSPFRDENGELVFRPGGHGSLIENLNDITAAVVFIKNIDNVVPDALRTPTLQYKKVIAGYLVELHDKITKAIAKIDARQYTAPDLDQMKTFMRTVFSFDAPAFDSLKGEDLADYLRGILDRPLRVCGMVRNEGEPGGGPYIAFNNDGSRSLQILESTQIDLSKDENKQMMAGATHFNPVDLVCYLRNATGGHFDLRRYVDPDTGFISSKSLHGRELRALELPGLWNGAMSHWNTAFVEVPIETFNPVKTVNDLLRPTHSTL